MILNDVRLVAFFKGTKAEFDKLGALAPMLMSAAADMRNHVSPMRAVDCIPCNGTGYVLVPNGPEDVDKEPCKLCNGTGRVVASN